MEDTHLLLGVIAVVTPATLSLLGFVTYKSIDHGRNLVDLRDTLLRFNSEGNKALDTFSGKIEKIDDRLRRLEVMTGSSLGY